MKLFQKFFLFATFALVLGLFVNSCGKDVVGCTDPSAENFNPDATLPGDCNYKGCTDPEAENYNPNANVSGDCTYARDKFLGEYLGSVLCLNALLSAVNSDSLDIKIEERATGGNDVKLNITVSGAPLALDGSVVGGVLTASTVLTNYPFNTPLGSLNVDIYATGTGTMDATNKVLTGTLAIRVVYLGTELVNDTCSMSGTKK